MTINFFAAVRTMRAPSLTCPPAPVRRSSRSARSTDRFTHPQEVADLVLYLASERAGNITGSDFVIDGGLIATL